MARTLKGWGSATIADAVAAVNAERAELPDVTGAQLERARCQIESRVDVERVPRAILAEAVLRLLSYRYEDARVSQQSLGDGVAVQTRPYPDTMSLWRSLHVGELLSPYIRRGSFVAGERS